jgi:putative addiction module component (TIGR02574 family)
MPMTLDQITEEASHLQPQQVAELVDRLTLNLHHAIEPEIEIAWKEEARRRVAELESGEMKAIPGEEVSERIRRIIGR